MEKRYPKLFSARWLTALFLFSAALNLLALSGPFYMLQVYDRVLTTQSHETLALLSLLVVSMYALFAMLDLARAQLAGGLARHFQHQSEAIAFDADMRDPATGQLSSIDQLSSLVTSPAFLAVFDLFWVPLYVLALFVFHAWIGWFALCGLALLLGVSLWQYGLSQSRLRAANEIQHRQSDQLAQAHGARTYLLAQGADRAYAKYWQSTRQHLRDQLRGLQIWVAGCGALAKSLRMLMQSLILGLGAWLAIDGAMSPGAMIAASIILGRALLPFDQIFQNWQHLVQGFAIWRGLDGARGANDNPPFGADREGILLDHVILARGGRAILAGIQMTAASGEAIGIIGPSASGKTSLGQLILGQLKPLQGRVLIDGMPADQIPSKKRLSLFGLLPQVPKLFDASLAQNIARMGDVDDQLLAQAIEDAGLGSLIDLMPEGPHTRIGADGLGLSGGQQQRVALARAVYGRPKYLILDEPNSALDSQGSDALCATIDAAISWGATVLIMTHRPAALKSCTRVIMLENGRIRADGPRDHVLDMVLETAAPKIRVVDA